MMKTILVIRKPDVFSRILAENSFEITNLPLIETKISEDLSDFETKLSRIENYDGIFLTSAKAAKVFREKSNERQINFRGKVYVLGRRSFDILKTEKLNLVFSDEANTAREMLEKIAFENLANKKFLFVRGAESLRIVPEFLAQMSAKVDETVVYETRKLTVGVEEIKHLREKLANKEFAAACFFSPSAARSFLEQFGAEILHQTVIAAIGKTTVEFFKMRNLTVDFVSSKSNAESFATEIIDFLTMTEIRENEEKGTIIIGNQEIEGFIDDSKICLKCSQNQIYYDDYDSFFCPNCNIWLESACSDPTCEFCRTRPKNPLK